MTHETAIRPARPRRARRQGGGCFGQVLNLASVGMLLLTCFSGSIFALLFIYPDALRFVPGGSAWMPLGNAPLPATAVALATSTLEPISTIASDAVEFPTLPPEWTATQTPTATRTPVPPTPTREPSATTELTATATLTVTAGQPSRTPRITATPSSTATASGPTPTPTRTATATITRSTFAYTLQPDSPTYLANILNTASCNWFGIAGRAFGLDGSAVIGLVVQVVAGDVVLPPVQTGSQPAIGPGGYEVYLNDHPIASTDVYKIQLFTNTGTALSEQYGLTTYGDCTRNLVMVNFVQNHEF